MPSLSDPITDTSYNLSRPGATLKKSAMFAGGMAMTALILGFALNSVLPAVRGGINSVTGGAAGQQTLPEGF